MYACMHGPGERIPFLLFLRRLWLKSFCHGFESYRCLGWGNNNTTVCKTSVDPLSLPSTLSGGNGTLPS